MFQKLSISKKTSPEEVSGYIKNLREQKGKEKQTLTAIKQALGYGQDFVVNMFWEEALTYQHMLMNDRFDKKALLGMRESIAKAEFVIKKYKLDYWRSRLFRFLGRFSDYGGEYKKAIVYYKKAIRYSGDDPEAGETGYPRHLELQAFLSFSLIMAGEYAKGLALARKTYAKFVNSREGEKLKKKDDITWGIWMSGIAIRTINAFLDSNVNFNKKRFISWLAQVETYLKGEGRFSYRKSEIKTLKQRLLNN